MATETKATGKTPLVLHTRVVTGPGGGPEKTILNSPRWLIPFGYDCLCAYMHPPGDPGFEVLRGRAVELEAPLVGVEDRGPLDVRVIRSLLKICREHRVTIWHGHDYKSNALGLVLRRFWPMHLVTTVHGWVVQTRKTPLYYWIDRYCLRRYEQVVCVSDDLVDACLASGVPAERCRLIENAIDTDRYRRQRAAAEAKQALGLPSDRLLLGAVGRLSPEKGFDGLIRAVERLLDRGRKVELAIVGSGPEQARLEAIIAASPHRERLHLLGFQANPIPFYEALDVFVLNSLREGLPNVVLEAMALELPIVSTRVAGVPRLLEHGVNGLLLDTGDAEQLDAALEQIVAETELRYRLGQAARQTVVDRYSFRRRMEKMRAVYDEVLRRVGSAHQETP